MIASVPPNPFRALDAYTRADRERFFGRDGDLTLILDRILTGRTTLLFAASGVGKTSFLNARVIPELEDRFFVAYHNGWSGGMPASLVAQSVAEQWNASAWGRTGTVDSSGAASVVAVYNRLDERLRETYASGSLLVLDQFEELAQQHADTEGLEHLVRELAEVINRSVPDVRVLFSMREEFLGDLSVFDNQVPDLFNNYYRLKEPSRRVARTIIAQTAGTVQVAPDPGLATLVDDLAAGGQVLVAGAETSRRVRDSVPPPFLQIACRGLWDKQFGGRSASGGGEAVPGARTFPANYVSGEAPQHLHGYAERILSTLGFKDRYWLSEALGFLVTRRGAKVAYEGAALADHSGAPEKPLKRVLDRLSEKDARLFRRTVAADGSVWYELYHDMYGPFFLKWRAEFHKAWRQARNRTFGAAAAAVVVATLAAGWFGFSRQEQSFTARSEAIEARYKATLLNRPAEEYRLRFGQHVGRVMDVAFSADGVYLATAAFDNTAKIWDSSRRLAVDTFRTTAGLHAVAFHPVAARKLLAVAGANEQVDLYNWETKRSEKSWQVGKTVYTLAFSPDGNTLASGGDGGRLLLFDLAGGLSQRLTLASAVNALAFTPDGRTLVVGDFSGGVGSLLIREWQQPIMPETMLPTMLARHNLSVLAVAVSPDGQWIASGGRDQHIYLSDRSGKLIRSLGGHTSSVRSVTFSPDSRSIASAGVDGTVRLWEVATGRQVATLLGHVGAVYSVAFSPSGTELASAGQDGTVRLWDVATRKEAGQMEGEWSIPTRAQFSPDLSRIITERSARGTHLWVGAELEKTFEGDVTALAMTPDTRQLMIGRANGSVTISNLPPHNAADSSVHAPSATETSGATWPESTLRVLTTPVHGIVLSGNGETMAVVSEEGREVKVVGRHASVGTSDTSHRLQNGPAWFVAVNAAGDHVALGNQKQVVIFRRGVEPSTPVRVPDPGSERSVLGIAYDVFQRLVIFYDNYTADVIKSDGSIARRLRFGRVPAGRATTAVATEDIRAFAFSDGSGKVSIWSVEEGRDATAPIELQLPAPVVSLSFARDGNRLGTLDRNGVVRLYSPFERAASRSY